MCQHSFSVHHKTLSFKNPSSNVLNFKIENEYASNANFLLFSSLFFLSLFIFFIDSGTQFGHLTQDQREEQFYFFFNRSVYYFLFLLIMFFVFLLFFLNLHRVYCSRLFLIYLFACALCKAELLFADILLLIWKRNAIWFHMRKLPTSLPSFLFLNQIDKIFHAIYIFNNVNHFFSGDNRWNKWKLTYNISNKVEKSAKNPKNYNLPMFMA